MSFLGVVAELDARDADTLQRKKYILVSTSINPGHSRRAICPDVGLTCPRGEWRVYPQV